MMVVSFRMKEKGKKMRYLWKIFCRMNGSDKSTNWGRWSLSLATYSGYSLNISILVSVGLFPWIYHTQRQYRTLEGQFKVSSYLFRFSWLPKLLGIV